ncbi:3-phosphoshikimate 1-carboxyvinyltransferase [uncultured Paraglaciecola sp.]|uniref:3-phosphoshikimate 1-carboxyvinyltransferase n=1 Tax=uncultured Paraglaciecola sp. TaxID=1765024 RepID=UPI0030D6FEE4|tara:strand:- start:2364 stop:2768 length:405 start_codon:yes stop_codon:yes gene_type:complete
MNKKFSGPIEEDPAIVNLLERMPRSVQTSFSEEQLSHLRNAVSSRQWGHHSIDLRGTMTWFKYRYYYVILAGKNHRNMSRSQLRASRFVNALLLAVFFTFSAMVGILLLYLLKSALGVDLFTDYSFGVWDWFKS